MLALLATQRGTVENVKDEPTHHLDDDGRE